MDINIIIDMGPEIASMLKVLFFTAIVCGFLYLAATN